MFLTCAHFTQAHVGLPCGIVYFLVNSQLMASFLAWMEILVVCFSLIWMKVKKNKKAAPSIKKSKNGAEATTRCALCQENCHLFNVGFFTLLKKRLLNASWHLEKIKAGNRHRSLIRWGKYAWANSNFWGINNNQNSSVLNVDEASSSACMCGWNLFKDRFSDSTQSSAGPRFPSVTF